MGFHLSRAEVQNPLCPLLPTLWCQPRTWGFLGDSTRGWGTLRFLSTNVPKSFSSGLLLTPALPSPSLCLGLP